MGGATVPDIPVRATLTVTARRTLRSTARQTTTGGSRHQVTAATTRRLASGDISVEADYDGDGRTNIAVFRPGTTNANWYVYQSSTSSTVQTQYGLSTDKPAPADLDGDGKADITVWRLSKRPLRLSTCTTTQSAVMSFAGYTLTSGDKVVSADFDGDGRANYALRNGSSWLMLNSAFANDGRSTGGGDQISITCPERLRRRRQSRYKRLARLERP